MSKVLHRLAFMVPPIRRLWLARNELLQERDALLENARGRASEITALQSLLDGVKLDAQSDALTELNRIRREDACSRAQGRRVDFDYGYDPQPRPRHALRRILEPILAVRAEQYRAELVKFAAFTPQLLAIAPLSDHTKAEPSWINDHMPGLDAVSIYGFLASANPRRYIEVGSGNSTKFARQAIKDHALRTRIISIDPSPRAEVDAICDEVMRTTCEKVEPSFYEGIGEEDVLFVDNSHRSFPNSDVTVFFTEILPILPEGVLFGIHDIFTPSDYPAEWRDRWYNEQYLLEMYLLGGFRGDEIVLPAAWVSGRSELMGILAPLFQDPRLTGVEPHGGALWLRRLSTRN